MQLHLLGAHAVHEQPRHHVHQLAAVAQRGLAELGSHAAAVGARLYTARAHASIALYLSERRAAPCLDGALRLLAGSRIVVARTQPGLRGGRSLCSHRRRAAHHRPHGAAHEPEDLGREHQRELLSDACARAHASACGDLTSGPGTHRSRACGMRPGSSRGAQCPGAERVRGSRLDEMGGRAGGRAAAHLAHGDDGVRVARLANVHAGGVHLVVEREAPSGRHPAALHGHGAEPAVPAPQQNHLPVCGERALGIAQQAEPAAFAAPSSSRYTTPSIEPRPFVSRMVATSRLDRSAARHARALAKGARGMVLCAAYS